MTPTPVRSWRLPDTARAILEDFTEAFGYEVALWARDPDGARVRVYPDGAGARGGEPRGTLRGVLPRDGPPLELEVLPGPTRPDPSTLDFLARNLARALDFDQEVHFFARELADRYEEINLLYSISETLGSTVTLERAAEVILREVCDVLGARRGSLWVHDPDDGLLHLVASVGEEGLEGPLRVDDPEAVTSRVFREGRPLIVERPRRGGEGTVSVLSVPIRYTPPDGTPRTVGVLNLLGRRTGAHFTASDRKLVSAVASQIGAALENSRLVRESLRRERMAREMELAHDLQLKLLPSLEGVAGAEVAARCEPAESVGGDFYHLFRLSGGRIGVMIGDVSSHGFPAALIMALTMSAAAIYAREVGLPADALRRIHGALREELESTEMYLSLFYGVLEPEAGILVYANAGHPHAFRITGSGEAERLLATDLPLGIAPPGEYHQRSVRWEAGRDLLLLFTDGLSDTLARAERRDGERRVVDEVVRHRAAPPEVIVGRLFELAAASAPPIPADDRTAIVVRA